MKKRYIIAVFAMVVALAIVGFKAWSSKEPAYQGKPLSDWVEDLDHKDPKTRRAALAAIREIGTNALPWLLRELKSKDSGAELQVKRNLPAKVVQGTPLELSFLRSMRAAGAFEALEEKAAGAVPALTDMLDDQLHRQPVLWALSQIGPAASPAVPKITPFLKDSNPTIRSTAIYALGRIHAQPQSVIPALTNLLSSTSISDRESAASGLGMFGLDARVATPMLIPMLQDPVPDVADAAKLALRKIDPYHVDTLLATLASAGGYERSAAALEVSSLWQRAQKESPQDEAALRDLTRTFPALREMMATERGTARLNAAWSLLWMDTNAIPPVIVCLESKESGILKPALKRLEAICNSATSAPDATNATLAAQLKPALPSLIRAMDSENETVRQAAGELVKKIGALMPPDAK